MTADNKNCRDPVLEENRKLKDALIAAVTTMDLTLDHVNADLQRGLREALKIAYSAMDK